MTTTVSTTAILAPSDTTAVICGLRALADYLEAHPELPTAHVTAAVHPKGETDADQRAAVDTIASALGVTATGTTHYIARRRFGPVAYEAVAITHDSMARYDAAQTYAGAVDPDTGSERH